MPTTKYPKNPNVETAFVTDEEGHRTRAVKTVVLDGTIDYPKNPNSPDCYVTVEGQKQRALMTADISSEGTLEYPNNSNSTKGYVTVDGKKQRVVLTASLVGGGSEIKNQDITVTSNGIYTADEGYTGLGTVDVQVPTDAPTYYIEKAVDANGQMLAGGVNTPNLNGVKSIAANALYYGWYGGSGVTGIPDFSTIETIGNYGMFHAFDGTNISSATFSSLTTVNDYGLNNAFANDTSLTTVDLSSVTTLGQYALSSVFYNCTGLTSINLSNLTTCAANCLNNFLYNTRVTSLSLPGITSSTTSNALYGVLSGSYVETFSIPNIITADLAAFCNNATHLTSVDLGKLEIVYSMASAFSGCSALTTVDISSLQFVSGSMQTAFKGCSSLQTINLDNVLFGAADSTLANCFENCTSLTSLTLSGVANMYGRYYAQNMCLGCTALTTASFPKLNKVSTTAGLQYAFRNCTSLTSVSFGGFALSTTNYNAAFANMLQGCSGVTVHFPAEWQATMASWSNVTSGFGGTNTTVLFDLPNVRTADWSNINKHYPANVFNTLYYGCTEITKVDFSALEVLSTTFNDLCGGCTSLTTADFSSLKKIASTSNVGFNKAFQNCSALTTVDFSSLEYITGGNSAYSFNYTFNNCTSLTSLDLSKLAYNMVSYSMDHMVWGCSALTSINLSSLRRGGNNSCTSGFMNASNLTDIYLPAMANINMNTFTNSMSSGMTAHIPSNFTQPFNPGTGVTVVKDLPGVYILTGANDETYQRNPKYDTATALAWRVQDSGSINNATGPTIDWTPYYTSGTADPVIGDTLYSDSACTTSVTTISLMVVDTGQMKA